MEEVLSVPKNYDNFSREDFLEDGPYEAVYAFAASPLLYNRALAVMRDRAKAVKFVGFNANMKSYIADQKAKRSIDFVPNQTEFTGQELILSCGEWIANDRGVFKQGNTGEPPIFACRHPITICRRLVNLDTTEVKLELGYKHPGSDRWIKTIVDRETVSSARSITSLSAQGISVTSNTASDLVDYLDFLENENYEVIPEQKSIGRLGYIENYGFSPYVDDLVFDGDQSFKSLYESVSQSGSFDEWQKIATECQSMSTPARVVLAASFAAPLVRIIGSNPFFVHLWGVDSGTGKTVALMLAASVWGNPQMGHFLQSFNATQVGQERTASFLNNLPMCVDEMQLTRDARGRSNFDVYQMSQGMGRSRGTKHGGIEKVPTWENCFITTGESPLTRLSAGAGAVNRVIDIETTAGTQVIKDGHRVSDVLKNNYGFAGKEFIRRLYETDNSEYVKEIYGNFYDKLNNVSSTEKQAMAASVILTADRLAHEWVLDGGKPLTVENIVAFLADKKEVSLGERAYELIMDWASSNSNKFIKRDEHDDSVVLTDIYGLIENNRVLVNRAVFDKVLDNNGYDVRSVMSYFKTNGIIETRGRHLTVGRTVNGIQGEFVSIAKQKPSSEPVETDILPF